MDKICRRVTVSLLVNRVGYKNIGVGKISACLHILFYFMIALRIIGLIFRPQERPIVIYELCHLDGGNTPTYYYIFTTITVITTIVWLFYYYICMVVIQIVQFMVELCRRAIVSLLINLTDIKIYKE